MTRSGSDQARSRAGSLKTRLDSGRGSETGEVAQAVERVSIRLLQPSRPGWLGGSVGRMYPNPIRTAQNSIRLLHSVGPLEDD